MTLRLLVPSSGCASRAPTGPCSLYFVAAPSSTFYQVLPQPHSPAATDTPSPAQVSLPSLSLQGASAPGRLPETLAPSHLPHELSAPYPWALALPASRPSPHEGLGLLSPVPPVSLTLSHLPILRLGPSQALSCLTSRLSSCQAALSLWPFPEWPGRRAPCLLQLTPPLPCSHPGSTFCSGKSQLQGPGSCLLSILVFHQPHILHPGHKAP